MSGFLHVNMAVDRAATEKTFPFFAVHRVAKLAFACVRRRASMLTPGAVSNSLIRAAPSVGVLPTRIA